jgi:fructan beta-fructosidase
MRHLFLAAALALSAAAASAAEPDLVVADFEGDTYGNWKVEGKAFGDRPAKGTLPNQMKVTGFRGTGLANSYAGGDGSTGTLTSPPFKVERDYLNFLIGGGGFPGKTCMNLLRDGKVVRTAVGPNDKAGGSEELAAAHWDVKEFKGKEVTIQIVDAATGGWGHVNVDHVVQSDTKAGPEAKVTPLVDRSREIAVMTKYLLFPIGNAAKPVRMTIEVEGKVVHDFDINLAAGKADWLAHMEVHPFAGKTAKVTAKNVAEDSKAVDAIVGSDDVTVRYSQPLYQEALRPQLRFSQLKGWNNDPNGMVYHDGEYHLFWQSNPFGPQWGNMYWGHAVSTDLVHWEELPYALYPRTMAKSHCFSGSAHVDEHNSGGWGAGAMVAPFTDTGAGECLAVSTDKGRTWKYLAENPVIPKRKGEGRDPKLIWYEPGKHWVVAVYTKIDKKDCVEFYSSKDLKKWEKTGHVEDYFECPELFELPVDGDAGKKKWVLFAADARYAVGTFDGKTFTPDHKGKHRVHHGPFYAPQCFNRAPGGRVIQVGWARIEMPNMPFNQAFSLPIELKLKTTAAGVRMFAEPVKEIETLRGNAKTVSETVTAEKPLTVKAPGQLMDIVLEVEPGDVKELKLEFGTNAVSYNVATQKLVAPLPDGKREEIALPLVEKKLRLRAVVDRPMFELVGNDGAAYVTAARKDGGQEIDAVRVSAVGGAATVSLTVHPMRSIWPKK